MKFSFWEDRGEQKSLEDFETSNYVYEAQDIEEALRQLQDDLYGHEESRTFVYKTDYEGSCAWYKIRIYRPDTYAIHSHVPITFQEVISLFEVES